MVAAQDAGRTPKELGDDPQIRSGRQPRVEGLIIVAGPGGHDERAGRAYAPAKSRNQAERTALDRPNRTERRMNKKDAAGPNA